MTIYFITISHPSMVGWEVKFSSATYEIHHIIIV